MTASESSNATSQTADFEAEADRYLREVPACSVLVVDDDSAIREALAEVLEQLGYHVAVAIDGQEAAELLELGLQPNAIVLDMMMPRMDGWTFLTQLRANPKFQEVPVVVATAMTTETPRGADALLQKPFDSADLHRAVRQLTAH